MHRIAAVTDSKKPSITLRTVARQVLLGLVTLVALDGVLWLIYPARTPEVQQTVEQNLPGLKPRVTYELNQFGLRSIGMRTKEKPERTIRILCLGASTTDQATQNTADTWSAILEKRLTEEFAGRGVRFEVAAYGRGGDKVFQTYHWARQNLLDFEPDLVVTLLGINDLAWHGGPTYSYDRAASLSSTGDGVIHFCRAYSQICRHGIRWVNQLRARMALATGESVEWHSRNLPRLRAAYASLKLLPEVDRDPDPIVEFSDGLDLLLAFLEEHHLATLVLAQPALWKPDLSEEEQRALWFSIGTKAGPVRARGDWLARELARYNRLQAQLAERHGAWFLDASLPRTLDTFFDDCHFTDRGSAAMAAAIYPILTRLVKQKLDGTRTAVNESGTNRRPSCTRRCSRCLRRRSLSRRW